MSGYSEQNALDSSVDHFLPNEELPNEVKLAITKGNGFMVNFIMMPAELKRIILSFLSEKELFDFLHINELQHYHKLAAEAYGMSHGNKPLYAHNNWLSENVGFTMKNQGVSLTNITIFKSYLKTFNKYIKNLKIDSASFQDSLPDIFATVAKYCANTLTRLEIRSDFYDGIETHVTNMSFPNVVELSLFSCDLYSRNLNLNQTFPNVRRLAVTFIKFSDRMWIDKSFNKLTHLQIHFDPREAEKFTENEILRILRKNPDISSLSIVNTSPQLLEIIGEEFSNIINLGMISLSSLWSNGAMICMPNVERFVFEGAIRYDDPGFVIFDNLKEIQWHSPTEPERLLLKFIRTHRSTIETIQIAETIILDAHLAEMHNILKLRRICLWNATITVDALFQFIEANERLSEIELFDVSLQLRHDIHAAFNASGLNEWLELVNPQRSEFGDIHLVKRGTCVESGDNTLEFLWDNFF